MTKPIPEGYHTITPSIMFKDTQKGINFYKKAFDAKVLGIFPNLNGPGIMHAAIKIGDSIVMMGDENANCSSATTLGTSPVSFFVYVPDVDAAFKKAIEAGGEVSMPVMEMFWGDRAGQIKDPFGYLWMIATHQKDLSDEEVKKNAEEFFAKMSKK